MLLAAATALSSALGAGKGDDAKEALQELQPFIGSWKGVAEKGASSWKESASWSWRFKGQDAWLAVEMAGSKLFKNGELRFLADKGKYQLTLSDAKGAKASYLGELSKGTLTLERMHPATKDIEQVKLNIAGGGVRLIHAFWVKPAERTLFSKQYQISYTKEGETFGAAAGRKGPECVVTGGLGTIAVSFGGATYYVCCTGCRDAFNENPAKILAEYKARKAAGK
jgi:hypothetical protein